MIWHCPSCLNDFFFPDFNLSVSCGGGIRTWNGAMRGGTWSPDSDKDMVTLGPDAAFQSPRPDLTSNKRESGPWRPLEK